MDKMSGEDKKDNRPFLNKIRLQNTKEKIKNHDLSRAIAKFYI